jgi:polyisoprenoid-binding protein YceI
MAQIKYQIDPIHSAAHFSVRHMMISNVRGEFTKLTGVIGYDPSNPANSEVDVNIEVASINTRDKDRDAHLRSADFFDADRFPQIRFRSKEVLAKNGDLKVRGDLTIRDVTREIVLDVDGPTAETKDPWGNLRIGATATAKLNRKDYGLTWNAALETGGVLVGEEVKITLDIEAIRQS